MKKATDQDGRSFTILRMPLPGTIFTSMSPGDIVYNFIKDLEYTNGSRFPSPDTIREMAVLS